MFHHYNSLSAKAPRLKLYIWHLILHRCHYCFKWFQTTAAWFFSPYREWNITIYWHESQLEFSCWHLQEQAFKFHTPLSYKSTWRSMVVCAAREQGLGQRPLIFASPPPSTEYCRFTFSVECGSKRILAAGQRLVFPPSSCDQWSMGPGTV